MVGPRRADRKNIQIAGHGAVPGVFKRQFGRIGLVESSCWRGEHDAQIMVITHQGRADVLDTYIDGGSAADWGKIP